MTVSIALVSLIVSVLSLALSGIVALYTLVWRGRLKMAQPTFLAFSYDWVDDIEVPKVVVRALVYATGKRGILIENMFLNLHSDGREQSFGIWGLTEGKLDRGAGLFASETGTVNYHHFSAAEWGDFKFDLGDYKVVVYAIVVGRKKPL